MRHKISYVILRLEVVSKADPHWRNIAMDLSCTDAVDNKVSKIFLLIVISY